VSTYSLNDAANILKVSPRRLRHWKRTTLAPIDSASTRPREFVDARDEAEATEGLRPDFDFRDLVCVRAILALLDRGISVQRIRRAVSVLQENVPDLEDPLAALRLWSDGSERIVVEHEGVLIEPEGQMVLDFGEQREEAIEPSPIHAPGEPANEIHDDVLGLFEQGCRLDSDPATYEEARVLYERCVELDPNFADAHCNLGAVLYNAGSREPARRCFERCLELDDRHVEGHFNLANVLEEVGCDEMALSHYRAALRADPFYAELHVNMALLYERTSQGATALDHWRRYLQLDPTGAWSEVARQRMSGDGPG
jgi:tetratricopeptide (TPR) repeat protein